MDHEFDIVWKALADPTRRALLDLLRDGPRTTGSLSVEFEVTRFGIMKHLAVLEDAGLVLVRRRGRERWNHLNAVPIQHAYERWLSPYTARWASSLLRLKEVSESQKEFVMPTNPEDKTTFGRMHIEQEILIEASRKKVFDALTRDVGAWWGKPYVSSDTSKALVIEAHVGGRFYEDYGDGDGELWGMVTQVKRGERLEITGACGMSGLVHGKFEFDLVEKGSTATLLKLSHRGMGDVGDERKAMYDAGWRDLLGTRLKAFVETGKRYGLGHEPPK